MEAEKTSRWRWGVNRWIVLVLIIFNAYFVSKFPPIAPHVQLPAEALGSATLPIIGEPLTNTLVATFLADIFLFVLAFFVWRAIRSGNQILSGVTGTVEAITDGLYSLNESTAGKWAQTTFLWMATIVFLVLIINWTELLPGVDSVGLFEPHHVEQAEGCTFDTVNIGSLDTGFCNWVASLS